MALGDDLNRYVVLEGNRRLTALKALENPDSFVGSLDPSALDELRILSKEYQNSPIDRVQCVVVKESAEADHWIELRHTGENEGAGIVPWKSDDKARFKARRGKFPFHSQVLNFLEQRGDLTPEERRRIPAASFKRLLGTPEVRAKLGIELEEGELRLLADEAKIAKALLHVIADLVTKRTKTGDIYTQELRIAYAEKLPASVAVRPTLQSGKGVEVRPRLPLRKVSRTPLKPKEPRARDYLIPPNCALTITDNRVRLIEAELKSLSLDTYSNAVSVLFRVFLELGVDAYLLRQTLPVNVRDKLRRKVEAVLDDLLTRQKLSRQQAMPVRRSIQKDSLLAPSIELLHQYVHNPYVFPSPSDLRASWDNLEHFVIAIWSP